MKYWLVIAVVVFGSVAVAQEAAPPANEIAVLKAEIAAYKAQIAKLSQKLPTVEDYQKAFPEFKASVFAQACKKDKGKLMTIRLKDEIAQGCVH